jgi:hypothetical protein
MERMRITRKPYYKAKNEWAFDGSSLMENIRSFFKRCAVRDLDIGIYGKVSRRHKKQEARTR